MTTRREFLVLACGAASITAAKTAEAQLDPNQAALRRTALQEAVRKVTGGAPVRSPTSLLARTRLTKRIADLPRELVR